MGARLAALLLTAAGLSTASADSPEVIPFSGISFSTPLGTYANVTAAGLAEAGFIASQLNGKTFRVGVYNGATTTPRFNGPPVCAPDRHRPCAPPGIES